MPDAQLIAEAVRQLLDGQLVAFPTETVYGLGADATNPDAVRRIFAAKGRPPDHPVIVHLADATHLPDWAESIPDAAWRLAKRFWPGPLTLVLPRAAHVSDTVTGGQPTIGLRVPQHPVAAQLLAALAEHGRPSGLAAPSANRFGRISPTLPEHVRAEFGDTVPIVLDGGAADIGLESTIVDLSGATARLLRPGHITASTLTTILGYAPVPPDAEAPRAPGMLTSHYAPRTPTALLEPDSLRALLRASTNDPAQRLGVLARHPQTPDGVVAHWITAPADAVAYAHALYRNLRQLDAEQLDRILIEAPPHTPAWVAVHDRLARAATAHEL